MYIIVDAQQHRRVLVTQTYKKEASRWLPIWANREHAQIVADLLELPGDWEPVHMDLPPEQIYHAITPRLTLRELYVGYVIDPGLTTERIVPITEQLPLRA